MRLTLRDNYFKKNIKVLIFLLSQILKIFFKDKR